MTQPATLATVYATDENIAVRAGDDYPALALQSNLLAYGTDGVIASGSPWVLSSASVNFGTNGVASGNVVLVQKGSPAIKGTGQLLAIDSASGNAITTRRLGQALNFGQAPGTGGIAGVVFTILTFGPQIEEISYDLNHQYWINPNDPGRSPGWLFDQRELRRMCVLMVLIDRYTAANRTSDGDWSLKIEQLCRELEALKDRTAVRWGPQGDASPPITKMSTRISR